MRFFISDLHLNHYNPNKNRGVITFERLQFKTIEEHDQAIVDLYTRLAKKLTPQDELWNLGDFGSLDFLWINDLLKCKKYFIYGNHDRQENLSKFEEYFDKVYLYPQYLSQKLVVSHFPVAVYEDTLNICGHLHNSKLQDNNHLIASLHVANYQPISDKQISAAFSKLPKFNRRFLYEPWAKDYQFICPREDVIMNYDGCIDLSASRVLQKINTERRIQENNSYQPYHGEGDFVD